MELLESNSSNLVVRKRKVIGNLNDMSDDESEAREIEKNFSFPNFEMVEYI
jgi:hypothetical protein